MASKDAKVQRLLSDYPPDRPSSFAIQYAKWLFVSGAAAEVGPDATAVLMAVVTLEDEFRYQRTELSFARPRIVCLPAHLTLETLYGASSVVILFCSFPCLPRTTISAALAATVDSMRPAICFTTPYAAFPSFVQYPKPAPFLGNSPFSV